MILATRFQLNPRTLPELTAGRNTLVYHSSGKERWELQDAPWRVAGAAPVSAAGQSYWANTGDGEGSVIFEVRAADGGEISGFDAGARFLDLSDGLAPDKFTAEVRKVQPWPAASKPQSASLAWSTSPDGPYRMLWSYNPKLVWMDGETIDRTLRWPEVDRLVRTLPAGTKRVYVRYELQGMAMDSPRLAAVRESLASRGSLQITHMWSENGTRREKVVRVGAGEKTARYAIEIPRGVSVRNESLRLQSFGPGQ